MEPGRHHNSTVVSINSTAIKATPRPLGVMASQLWQQSAAEALLHLTALLRATCCSFSHTQQPPNAEA
jgi:hypothetical protein